MKKSWCTFMAFGMGYVFTAAVLAEESTTSPSVLPPAAVVGLFSQLQGQMEKMKSAYTLSAGVVPRSAEASAAALQFSQLVQQVPLQSQMLPAEKQVVVARDVQKLVLLAGLVDKYARQSDAISETQKFIRKTQTYFEELKAQLPSGWIAKLSKS